MRKICIFGAGAVGGHIAAMLSRGGLDVSVVARGAHLEAIRSQGLRFRSATGDFTVHPRAVSDPRELGTQDLVITTLKAYALPGAVDALLTLLGPRTPVVFAVNGIPWWYFYSGGSSNPDARLARLDPGGRLWNVLGAHRAIGCVISSPNEVTAPGVIQNNRAQNDFVLGEPDGTLSPRLAHIVESLQPALPGLCASPAIRETIWNKLLLNLAGSPLSALTNAPWIEFADNGEMIAVFRSLVAEATRVASQYGVGVTTTAGQLLVLMRQVRHVPSMLHDLQAGRALETDAILRAVQDMARAARVPTPTLDIVTALLVQQARQAVHTPTRRS